VRLALAPYSGQGGFASGIRAFVITLLIGKPEDPREEAFDVLQGIDVDAIGVRYGVQDRLRTPITTEATSMT